MKKLSEDSSWKDAHPAFTCDLWHSRCMKEYFTMTAHWIEIGGSPLAPHWELRRQVLGAYAVEDSPIDHQGACTLCMTLSQAEFPLSLRRCLIVVLLCTYSRCKACRGAMPFVQIACGLSCYCHRFRGQRRQGFQHHSSMGLASLWMPSPTQCGEGGAG